ncbi:MAG: hypothetical protein Ct9H90mP2_10100 [Dehalococcoidia bacterium]|nr:MAG: hypothetical protein Ct9H90mP2_10100 [Dehalococcoidia bacterium]
MLIDACKEYIRKTNRKIFFEYVLLNGQNDSLEHATNLGKLFEKFTMPCKFDSSKPYP